MEEDMKCLQYNHNISCHVLFLALLVDHYLFGRPVRFLMFFVGCSKAHWSPISLHIMKLNTIVISRITHPNYIQYHPHTHGHYDPYNDDHD